MILGQVREDGKVVLSRQEAEWLSGVLASLAILKVSFNCVKDAPFGMVEQRVRDNLGYIATKDVRVTRDRNLPEELVRRDLESASGSLIYSSMEHKPAPPWARKGVGLPTLTEISAMSNLEDMEARVSPLIISDDLFIWSRFE